MYSGPKRRVEGDEFVLRDAKGAMRAALTMTLDGPGLFLYDQNEVIRAGLLVGKEEPGLALFDCLGRPRVSLGLAGDEPKLLLRDDKGIPRAAMTVEETGARLMLSDAKSGPRIGFAAENGEVSLVFAAPDGKPRIVLGMPGGVPGLTLLDEGGRRRAKLEIEEETSTFELFDSDGKTSSTRTVVWVEARLQAADLEAKLGLEATARKELEETLRAGEKRHSALVAATGQLVWTTNAAGEVIEDIPLWRSFTGQNEEEIKGLGWMQALCAEDRERVMQVSKQALEIRSPYETEYRMRRQDGEYRDFAVRAVPVLQDDEAVREWVVIATDISERKRLEDALRVSEERLSALTAAQAQGEEALRMRDERLAALTVTKAQLEETQRKLEGGHATERKRMEDALRASDERLKTITAAKAQLEEALRVREEHHKFLTVAHTQLQASLRANELSHTTERKRLEDALRASEENLRVLTAAKAELKEALRVSEERQNALTVATTQLQESLRASELTHTTDRNRLEESLRASEERLNALSAAKSQLEETLRTSREDYAAGRTQLEEALRASEEQLNDQIVAKGQLEKTLRAREEHYRALTAATAQLVWTTNAAGEIIDAASSWTTFTGQSAEEAQGRGWFEALQAEDREGAAEVLKQALETRSPYKTEYRLRRHDGEYRVLAVRGAPVVEDDGAVHEWIGTATDITEDKQAETLRRASEKKYRQIVEGAPEGIWILDPDNRTTFVNPRLAQMLGWSGEEMPGKSLLDFLDEEGRESAVENLGCCRRGVAAQFDLPLRNKEGQNLRTRASTLPLFDEAGQYSGALALIIDLTEQKLLEGQQQQAEKLQALGQLAGGVAHGLNNFLTVINGYTDLLLGKVPRSNPLHESVAQIKKAGEQAGDLVSPLLAFSQGQILWAKVLDVNEVVKEAEKTLRGKLGEDIRLATALSPALGPVKADPEQLQQVLMNLAANARDAMRGGGSLVIETQNADLDESYAAKHPGVKAGPYVHLKVSDSGTGMSEEMLSHLFEPFFTTKTPGQGLGLGLATVYGIIKQSGGSIRVESELGKGSSFHVYLPRMGEAIPLVEEGKPAVSTLRGTETVLVVDDQEEIRKLAQVVLKSNGYKVVAAANGWEALLYSERHAGPIHLMLTDVVMPGMTGKELADQLRPLRPEMAVVFMSGYMENGTVQPGALAAKAGFLAKPFSPDALATKVREVLGPSRSPGRVLVVDDEAGIRSFLRMVLVSVGYEVLEANDGEQALKQLDGEVVDLILVNLGTPNQHDLEKIHLLQKKQPDLKVIAMSEAFGNEFLRAAEQLGAQATLAKPIRADQLLETIRRTATEE